MTIQAKIDALLAQAAPLRLLPDIEAERLGLPGIVDAINALRALPVDAEPDQAAPVAVEPAPAVAPAPVKRAPGRPRKATIEGADA